MRRANICMLARDDDGLIRMKSGVRKTPSEVFIHFTAPEYAAAIALRKSLPVNPLTGLQELLVESLAQYDRYLAEAREKDPPPVEATNRRTVEG